MKVRKQHKVRNMAQKEAQLIYIKIERNNNQKGSRHLLMQGKWLHFIYSQGNIT